MSSASGLPPSATILSATSLTFSAATTSRLSRSTIGFGVLAGAKAPTQNLYSASGRPISVTVGTSGISGSRFRELTASELTLPSFVNDIAFRAGAGYVSTRPGDDFGQPSGVPRKTA